MLIRSIATLFAALALSACGSNGDIVWQEPIELSPRVQAAYDAYTKLPNPSHFAVSEDGQAYGYTYCPAASGSGCSNRGVRSRVIRNCEEHSGGSKCKIYAIGVSQIYSGQ